jgi:glucose-6-phosphate 1-epimerase
MGEALAAPARSGDLHGMPCMSTEMENFEMDPKSMVAEFDRRFGIPGVARVCEGNGAMPRVQITSSLGEGEIYLHGAQVTSWKPAGTEEVLFLSAKSRWEEGQAIRGGIPVCFPWFRGKANDPQAPAHGFVRTKAWQIESIVENGSGVTVSMFTESDERTQRWWPGEFRLVQRATFGSELSLELVCTNTGTTPLRFEEALHTYNRVADVHDARLHGLDTVSFLDNTDSNREKTQRGDAALASQTDNAYVNTQNAVDLLDPKMHRRIRLTKANSLTTVVWNPWREGANKLRDLGDDEWTQFLCVEASNILSFAINLEPGQEHRMLAVLSVAKF